MDDSDRAYRLARADLQKAIYSELAKLGQPPVGDDNPDSRIAISAAELDRLDATGRIIDRLLGEKTKMTAKLSGAEAESLARAMSKLANAIAGSRKK